MFFWPTTRVESLVTLPWWLLKKFWQIKKPEHISLWANALWLGTFSANENSTDTERQTSRALCPTLARKNLANKKAEPDRWSERALLCFFGKKSRQRAGPRLPTRGEQRVWAEPERERLTHVWRITWRLDGGANSTVPHNARSLKRKSSAFFSTTLKRATCLTDKTNHPINPLTSQAYPTRYPGTTTCALLMLRTKRSSGVAPVKDHPDGAAGFRNAQWLAHTTVAQQQETSLNGRRALSVERTQGGGFEQRGWGTETFLLYANMVPLETSPMLLVRHRAQITQSTIKPHSLP